MTVTIRISWDKEYQPWECVATDTSRPVLTYIHIDPRGWAVAADGFVLCVVPVDIEKEEDEEFEGILAPAQLFKTATLGKRVVSPFLEIDGTRLWTYDKDTNKVESPRGEGTYPNWRALLPEFAGRENQENPTSDTMLANLDSKLLSKLVKGLGLGKESRATLRQLGAREAVYVHALRSPESFGLIMPIGSDDSEVESKFEKLVNGIRLQA